MALLPAAAGAKSAKKTAFDYAAPAQAKKLTKPRYETQREVIKLPAFDGEELYIEVVRPKAAGDFPVILEASPYHGTLADRDGTRIFPGPKDADGNPIGLTGYFAPRGYAVVMMDLRGTGRSQGCLDHLGDKDARDLEQVVEWSASQGWSNGRVGMTGHSYVGSTPSVAAAQNPKGLATIVPSAGLASMYHHQFQAGVPYMLQWAGVQWSYEYLTVARKLPPVGADPVQGANTGDDFGNNNEETGCGADNSALVAGEDQLSGRYADWHLERDWNRGSTQADIPIFAVHGVNDNAARVGALEWWFDRRNAKDKLWLGQWDHGSGCCPNRRGQQWTYALHAWFDRHLAKRKVNTGPRMELFMSDNQSFSEVQTGARTEILTAKRWPVAKRTRTFFPTADGGLGTKAPAEEGSQSFTGTPEGFAEFASGEPSWQTGVSFATEPFKKNVVMAGIPDLELVASVTMPRVHLIANLLDEDAEGKRRRISQFAINPELRNGIGTETPVTPGERYTLEPPGFAMAQHIRKGHRLVLQVTTSDPDKVPMFSVDPQVTVFTGADGTNVTVPVVRKPRLVRDRVPLESAEDVPDLPPQPPVEATVTMKASGGGVVHAGGVTSEYVEFDVLPDHDNAKMEGVVTPAQPADLDLYLERETGNGEWTAAGDGANGAALDGETISTGRLAPGHYRLEIHNYAGAPGNEVAVKLTFLGSDKPKPKRPRGQAG
ncbi:MAG TPA: CocE/NonD family hydrolase [Thermoleophilaceae bacterium]|nr:CocE/NonD family hydrolase [Thermoleophilaceae bacterium]